jgi:tetratricopeptide (TPR) repeat protein/phage shock protein PspC (stress-responsive transcriptional regulator)
MAKPGREPTKPGAASPLPTGRLGGLRRSGKNTVLAGVCGGLSEVSDIPAWGWRLIFLAGIPLSAFGVLGFLFLVTTLAYLALWLVAPRDATPRPTVPPLFRKIDWWTCGITALLIFIGYYWTLAPDLTLEDSGELAVGSFYAGVPHPPGYPVWTIYTWLFTVLVPFSNIAWRVALSSAVAGALSCGLIALLASRGSSMMLESIEELKGMDPRWENALCMVAGYVAGMLVGFNGFMWSQAVIVEVYPLSVLSLMGVLCCLLRWIHAPEQHKYLYWTFFLFGVCITNHQTLIVAAMGLEVAIVAAKPKLGRDFLLANSIVFLLGLALGIPSREQNFAVFVIFCLVGIASVAACVWMSVRTEGLFTEIFTATVAGLFWTAGALFNLFMPVASSTNPPMNWGYARTWEGFVHALTRGQYEKTNPTSDPGRFLDQMGMLLNGAVDEFNLVYLAIALIPLICLAVLVFREGGSRHFVWLGGIGAGTTLTFLIALRASNALAKGMTQFVGIRMQDFVLFNMIVIAALLVVGCIVVLDMAVSYLRKPERAWLLGLAAISLFLSVLLIVLLNPSSDRQSRDMNRVFFTASHVMVALCVGYGLAILGGLMQTRYQQIRRLALYGTAVAAAIALYSVTFVFQGEGSSLPSLFGLEPSHYWLVRFTVLFSLVLALVAISLFMVARRQAPMAALLGLFVILPVDSVLSHWSDNEQRGHLFGYWFGHDMFTPPFDGADGKPLYPPMAKDAILFGGTDPGRFCPTYMIFCEGFIPPRCRRDPAFDRRDVYIITQNALADGTYLEYIRAHYNRSTQRDAPFFQGMVGAFQDLFLGKVDRIRKVQGQPHVTNFVASAFGSWHSVARPLDDLLTRFGKKVEDRRRDQGVYPPQEIYTPNPGDHEICMRDYFNDAERRARANQLKPGEDVRIDPASGKLQVSGQVAVMAINGLLTKVIFDHNPTNEFYVEESFPLDWMFPYLEPYGIIMRINRQPLPEISEDKVKRDHEFWSQFSERLIGNWITYDTPVKDICDFVVRVHERRDYDGFKGDRKFIRDDQSQKAFSKLRSSIGGIYSWRVASARTPEDQQRMLKEADFAFRQAFAFCPYSPEAMFRYTTLLVNAGRIDDAVLITQTGLRFDRDNATIKNWVDQLKAMQQKPGQFAAAHQRLAQLEAQYRANSADAKVVFDLASLYLQMQRTNAAVELFDKLLAHPNVDLNSVLSVANAFAQLQQGPRLEVALRKLDNLLAQTNVDLNSVLSIANAYAQLQQGPRLEVALRKLVTLSPESAEAWYDLAATQAILSRTNEALQALTKAVELSSKRLALDPTQRDLRKDAATNRSFAALYASPEFRKLIAAP